MNKIIILRGNSASGKSTTAIGLQKKLERGNSLLIQQDNVRREMLWEKWESKHVETIKLIKSLVEYGNKNYKYTILEGILYPGTYDELFKMIMQLYGENIHAYYFDVPFEETVKRQKQRPIHNKFGETEMKEWWREKDFIKFIPEKIIDAVKMSNAEVVEMIFEDVVD